jgi:hypothetical protein
VDMQGWVLVQFSSMSEAWNWDTFCRRKEWQYTRCGNYVLYEERIVYLESKMCSPCAWQLAKDD